MGWYVAPAKSIRCWVGPEPRPPDRVVILPKTTYSFDGRPNQTQRIVLAEGIDTALWRTVVLELRLHDKNVWQGASGSTNATAWIETEFIAIAPEEPGVTISDGRSVATTTFGSGTVAPWMTVRDILVTLTSAMRITLVFAQGSIPAVAPQTFAISVHLTGRHA